MDVTHGLLLIFLIGALAGLGGASLGIGGGLIAVPGLLLVGSANPVHFETGHVLVLAALVVLTTSLTGIAMHYRNGTGSLAFDRHKALLIAIAVGSMVASAFVSGTPAFGLTVLLLLTQIGIALLLAGAWRVPASWGYGRVGFVTGVLSTFCGIGGGLILMPALMSREPMARNGDLAVVSASGGGLIGLTAVAADLSVGRAVLLSHWDVALALIAGSIAGAVAGANVIVRLPKPTIQKSIFCLLLFSMGMALWRGFPLI